MTQRLAGLSVLVVEDDEPSGRLVGVLLGGEGATVKVVPTAESALDTLPEFPAPLMIVDLVLPRMSGLLLMETLKATSSTRDIVAIAISAVNGPEAERLALESGYAAYLRKPIDIDTLLDLVVLHFKGQS